MPLLVWNGWAIRLFLRREGERSGIVCFKPYPNHQDLTAQQLANELAARNIHIAVRSDVVRISPHFYNTLEEIDALLNALEELK